MHQYKSLMIVTVLGGVMVVMAGVLLSTEQMARKQQDTELKSETEVWTPLGGQRRLAASDQLKRDLDRLGILSELETSPKALNELERILLHAAQVTDKSGLPILDSAFKRAANKRPMARALVTIALLTEIEAAIDLAVAEEQREPGCVADALNRIANMAPSSLRKIVDPRVDLLILSELRAGKTVAPTVLEALRARLSAEQISALKKEAGRKEASEALRAFSSSIR